MVIAAVIGLLRFRALAKLWKLSRPQALVAYATFALTLGLAPHIEQAIMLGVLLSVAVHLWRELKPNVRSWTEGSSLHLEPQGVLWFGSASAVEAAFLKALSQRDTLDRVVVHLGGIGRLDLTGALTLRRLLDDAAAAGIEAEIVDVPPHAVRILGSCLGWKSQEAPEGETPPAEESLPEMTPPPAAGNPGKVFRV
jgi:SulP family sulfate permease